MDRLSFACGISAPVIFPHSFGSWRTLLAASAEIHVGRRSQKYLDVLALLGFAAGNWAGGRRVRPGVFGFRTVFPRQQRWHSRPGGVSRKKRGAALKSRPPGPVLSKG